MELIQALESPSPIMTCFMGIGSRSAACTIPAAVQVFFDPRAPQAAVLERRVPFAWFTPYAIWGTIGFGVLMLALSFWRRAATWPGGARDLVP